MLLGYSEEVENPNKCLMHFFAFQTCEPSRNFYLSRTGLCSALISVFLLYQQVDVKWSFSHAGSVGFMFTRLNNNSDSVISIGWMDVNYRCTGHGMNHPSAGPYMKDVLTQKPRIYLD